ncbi:hypothetical protein OF385_06225 [Glutamicibacter sp. JL.03c]|uniref:hypothetical protein n=1 Tax=Glutamicibacter sp. JL.03c TaxID=2984842 RepID=UPI0021F7097E|nr:hypothetical protein [Glutamicibacter sp. JL.03c]UYQ78734.1 hypothetical protein OF385_06225 [Glutamicibacter sp. JL.03c]
MKSYLPRAARNYLEQLRQALDFLSEQERKQVLDQTRGEILRLPGGGRRKRELFGMLGEPATRARKFARTEPEDLEVRSGKHFLTRILAWPIFALALMTVIIVLFAPPQQALIGTESVDQYLSSGNGWLAGLEEAIGSQLIWLAFIPVVFSLLPLWLHGGAAMVLQVLGAVAMTAVCLGGGILSLYFIPVTLLLWAQVFTPLLMMRGSMARPGPAWLATAAVLLIVAIAMATYQGVSHFAGAAWVVLSPAVLLAVLAALLPTRWRSVHIALVVAGLLVMAAGFIAALPSSFNAVLLWPWLAGGLSFAVGHLAVAAGMWNERARKLLALF